MVLLTVFTPAYNRADTLVRSYKALQNQTSMNFKWLIIDDGSTDETKSLVETWMQEKNEFEILYIYKENGGLHTAYNTAIENLDTELAVCIDSDDYMPEQAVEMITDHWRQYGSDTYAGIVGLDFTISGVRIGDRLPEQKAVNLIDLALGKYHLKGGDRKLVVRSELYKAVAPMKVFPGEKNFNPNYMHMEISKKYDFLVLNENLCNVEYLPNGMTNSMMKQYYNSPRSFAELRKQHLSFRGISFKYKCKEYIHYISSCFLARQWCGLEHPNWLLMLLLTPFGFALSMIIVSKNR